MSQSLRAKLDAANSEVLKDSRYAVIHAIIIGKDNILDSKIKIPTACTDGINHYWHPDFVAHNSLNDLRLTKIHESIHDVLYHTDGRGKELVENFGKEIAGIAMDHADNNFMVDCGETLDDSWYCDRQYAGWSIWDIASDLKANGMGQGGGGGGGGGGKGTNHEKMMNASPKEQAEAKEKTDSDISNSSIMNTIMEASGLQDDNEDKGNSQLGSMLDKVRSKRNPFIDWRLELIDFCGSSKSDERISTFARINRRPNPPILKPGKKRESNPCIGVILDTSGSMVSSMAKLMVELEAMSDDGFSFSVLCTDGKVYGPFEFESNEFDSLSLPLQGGGGSNMQPAFDVAKEIPCDAWVFFTDGHINWPSKKTLEEIPPCLLIHTCRINGDKGIL